MHNLTCNILIMTGITSLPYPPDSETILPIPKTYPEPQPQKGDEEIRQTSISTIINLVRNKPKVRNIWNLLHQDSEINAHWDCANYITVKKLGMNDHGRVHAMVATASALRIFDLLVRSGITPDLVSAGIGDLDDAYLVVLTAALCHDIGNQIHREDHITHSLILVAPILDRILPQVYDESVKIIQVRAFILSLIYSHHGDPRPLTIEAGAVCIGDATDMTTGRARSAYDQGRVTIHTISALSIDQVSIDQGKEVPVEITIRMSNSAGLFQVQEILGPKIAAGPITQYIEVKIRFTDESSGVEKQILSGMKLGNGVGIEEFYDRD
ncbi:MAG: HD domain-containing protein [Methanospirillum sp.]|uniref:HD domain-containing protein n=1 Tax=Methanospirillum sp. TaxID=45200 RepID=UPI0023701719|nr:HD domain-containing protein [Methanospirillum sp.]MDD1728808.1 HD domain-containing protein [Methanospirillum sp.]